ncbi:cadherin-like beta sandwich domain-containing protein, partial [Candidatus Synechococcus spongiarum]
MLLGIPGLLAPAGLVAAPTALLLGGLSLLHAAPAAAQAQLPERFRLTSLTLSVGGSPVTLTPSFTPATNLFYRATVDYDATSISVTASWSGSKAVLASSKDWRDLTAPFLSEEAFASSGSSVSLNLKAGGVTGINLSVDTTTTYNITIHRRPSTDATLSGLTASTSTSASGTFTALTLDTFAAGTTAYTATVANERTHVKLTPTVNDSNATVKVGKGTSLTAVTSGSASGAISLQVGANAITVKVTAQDGSTTKTYTVTVTREGPPTVSFQLNTILLVESEEDEPEEVVVELSKALSESATVEVRVRTGGTATENVGLQAVHQDAHLRCGGDGDNDRGNCGGGHEGRER